MKLIVAILAVLIPSLAYAQGVPDPTQTIYVPMTDKATAEGRSIQQGWAMGIPWDDPLCQPNCKDALGDIREPSLWWKVTQIDGGWYLEIENIKRGDFQDFTANPVVVDPMPVYLRAAAVDPKFKMPSAVPIAGAITGLTPAEFSSAVGLTQTVVTVSGGHPNAGDVESITFTNPLVNGFPLTVSYTVQFGDKAQDVALALGRAISQTPALVALGIWCRTTGVAIHIFVP